MIRLFNSTKLYAVLLLGACGLVSTDITLFRLHLPPKDFSVDTSDWGLSTSGPVPVVSCTATCPANAAICSGGECTLICETGNCAALVDVSLSNDYDLANEASGYADIADQSVVSVVVDDIFFDIRMNTLTVDTPELTVVIGPQTITNINSSGALIIGTIPVIPAGHTGRVDVVFISGGQATLKRFLDDFRTPFRVLVVGKITVHGGDTTPTGKLVGDVQADAHVSL
jgi:hypothetical protein